MVRGLPRPAAQDVAPRLPIPVRARRRRPVRGDGGDQPRPLRRRLADVLAVVLPRRLRRRRRRSTSSSTTSTASTSASRASAGDRGCPGRWWRWRSASASRLVDVRLPRSLPDAPSQPRRVPVRRRRRARRQPPPQPHPRPSPPGTAAGGARRLARRRRARQPRHIEATEREVEVVGHVDRSRPSCPPCSSEGQGTDVLLLDSFSLDAAFPEPMTVARGERQSASSSGRRPRHAARAAGGAGDRRHAVRAAARAQLPVVQGAAQALVRPHPARADVAAHRAGAWRCWRCTSGSAPAARCSTARRASARTAQPFTVVKFRTMHRDAEAGGARLATAARPPHHQAACAGCARRGPTSCRSCGTCCAARCRSSAHGRSDPS